MSVDYWLLSFVLTQALLCLLAAVQRTAPENRQTFDLLGLLLLPCIHILEDFGLLGWNFSALTILTHMIVITLLICYTLFDRLTIRPDMSFAAGITHAAFPVGSFLCWTAYLTSFLNFGKLGFLVIGFCALAFIPAYLVLYPSTRPSSLSQVCRLVAVSGYLLVFCFETVLHVIAGKGQTQDLLPIYAVLLTAILITLIFPRRVLVSQAAPETGHDHASSQNVDPIVLLPEEDLRRLSAMVADARSLLHETQLYQDAGLTIGRLAKRLHVPEKELSKAINLETGQNFSQFINDFRVEEAKGLLSDLSGPNLSIIDIQVACGFNSKSNFNLVFKKATGHTPSEYRAMTTL